MDAILQQKLINTLRDISSKMGNKVVSVPDDRRVLKKTKITKDSVGWWISLIVKGTEHPTVTPAYMMTCANEIHKQLKK